MAERPTSPREIHAGVDPDSWLRFEDRVRQRRFDALLVTGHNALRRGDVAFAEHALSEAQEIHPEAEGVNRLAAAIAVYRHNTFSARLFSRTVSALGLLGAGVLMFLGVEALRTRPIVNEPPSPQSAAHSYPPATAMRMLPIETRPGTTGVPFVSAVNERRPVVAASLSGGPSKPGARRALRARPVVPPFSPPFVLEPEATVSNTEIPPTTITVAPPSPFVNEVDTHMPGAAVASLLAEAAARVAESAPPGSAATSLVELAGVLRQYAEAYSALNMAVTRQLWPGVDERALTRAFDSLALRRVLLKNCDISVRGSSANASCHGAASDIDAGDSRAEPRTWRFEFRRDGETWKIENAESRHLDIRRDGNR